MAFFPEEIISRILVKTSIKSVFRFRCVSKLWNNLLTDPSFLNLVNPTHILVGFRSSTNYLSMYPKERGVFVKVLEDFKVPVEITSNFDMGCCSLHLLASCNGLILSVFDSELFLWNPITHDCIKLPKIDLFLCGFGYDWCRDDYNVVVASFIDGLQVYSVKSRSWKKIRGFSTKFNVIERMGISVKGVLHWLVVDAGRNMILSFDSVITKKFKKVREPVEASFDILEDVCVFEGLLCLVYCRSGKLNDTRSLWVMKHYGDRESWTKLMEIPCRYRVKPLCFNENGELICQRDGRELMKYNPARREFKKFFYCESRTIPVVYSEDITRILRTPKTTDHHGTETKQSNVGE